MLLIPADMQPVMTTSLLTHICCEINAGRPLWALLWANRYLAARDPLRKTLARKVQDKITQDCNYRQLSSVLLTAIFEGKALADLSDKERAEIIACKEPGHKINSKLLSTQFNSNFSGKFKSRTRNSKRRELFSRAESRANYPRFQVQYAAPRRAHTRWSAE